MNQQEQKWLVILHSLIESDGGGKRHQVLHHIQENSYWYKNDDNDTNRKSRNEKAWRNDFSYERQHLVDRGYMQKGIRGIWKITESGRIYFYTLIEKSKNLEPGEDVLYTAFFYQKLFGHEIYAEEAADQLLLEQLADSDKFQRRTDISLKDEPLPKGAVSNRTGNKNIYLRKAIVSQFALDRAGHFCEIDEMHISFVRKGSADLYMEPHHLIPMSMTDFFGVSLDREQNIFSLCSNCHNQIHYGIKDDVRNLISTLFLSRENEICAILGRTISLNEIYQIYKVL